MNKPLAGFWATQFGRSLVIHETTNCALFKTDDIFTSRRRQCRFLQKITYFEVFRLEETPLAGLGSFLEPICGPEAIVRVSSADPQRN
jgi:hypothetical protein